MPKEKSVGAVVISNIRGETHFLLLRYPSSIHARREYWDFPKGHVEAEETEDQTMRREVQEETGLRSVSILKGFREPISYHFRSGGKTVFKTVIFYLVRTKGRNVNVSHEHIGYAWIPYTEAMAHLKFQNAKTVLQKAHNFLSKKGV
jgi:bis(5'-nucleosidyl)-tetraphosphatase